MARSRERAARSACWWRPADPVSELAVVPVRQRRLRGGRDRGTAITADWPSDLWQAHEQSKTGTRPQRAHDPGKAPLRVAVGNEVLVGERDTERVVVAADRESGCGVAPRRAAWDGFSRTDCHGHVRAIETPRATQLGGWPPPRAADRTCQATLLPRSLRGADEGGAADRAEGIDPRASGSSRWCCQRSQANRWACPRPWAGPGGWSRQSRRPRGRS